MASQYVRDIMTRNLVTAEPEDNVVSALQLMRASSLSKLIL